MIGVLAHESQHLVVREFFELFKTPWEFYRAECQYEVIICCDIRLPNASAKLVLLYGANPTQFDQEKQIEISSQRSNTSLSYKGEPFPIYGNCLTFKNTGFDLLLDEGTQKPAAIEIASKEQVVLRIGFDLFNEIRHLLTRGQPPAKAGIPAVEVHISVVRDLIVSHSICVVEIPPIPTGYNFIVCLTHDVDHLGVRNHKCDHTMFGFLYRAVIGSLIDFCKGRRSAKDLLANWKAACSLPFVHLGLAKDFWKQLGRYLEIENGIGSTFFVIPHKGDPGQGVNGAAPTARAAQYDLSESANCFRSLLSAGREIGLHGIDAWCDSNKGHAELERIRSFTGASKVGVRMHWLFFNEQSAALLEQAGFSYDSTVGYNETVGYRAGTTQAFKPLGVEQMLELPMHMMDTALFFPSHMSLSSKEAKPLTDNLINNVIRFGGVLTVNWHDRSIAPERLWEDFYVSLLKDLKSRGVWFPTAEQAVAWFRKRRSTLIEDVTRESDGIRVKVSLNQRDDGLPRLRLRVHKMLPKTSGAHRTKLSNGFTDIPFSESQEIRVAAV